MARIPVPMYVGYVPPHTNGSFQPWESERQQSQFPPVNIQGLDDSVKRFRKLMRQADLLIDKLAEDREFATELASAAQQSNHERVNELILSTGITIDVKTTFTPTAIRIILDNSEVEGGCCDLLIALRW